ncbi:MAG: hypothetical protein MPN21_14415 [Thermoanaerobaculia bacterium]|nr:hypothetical protein [Thermoanaerobaculia bacterium]
MASPEKGPDHDEEPPTTGAWENLGRSDGLYPTDRTAAPQRPSVSPAILLVGSTCLALLVAEAYGTRLHPAPAMLLVVLLVGLALRDRWRAERALAFYSRFVRPGLQRLLREEKRMLAGDKLFRGRRTVVLKIDMADYTKTTYRMPYGIRRLFVDLWFTAVDRVVARDVFLDKNLGDGSLYCFEDADGDACTAALRAAVQLRDREVGRFDEAFRSRLRRKLESAPELAAVTDRYLDGYREATGHDFWSRHTTVRIALAVGHVDEGLWGLSSQSHYDVQGAPPILATRLEDRASNGEIVFDDRFLRALEAESPGLLDLDRLEHRTEDLKGIGPWEIWVLPEGVGLQSAHGP